MQESCSLWQEYTCSVAERDAYIWTNHKWTDCVFHVGPDKQEFCCHRVYLAKSSPVFEAMLFGDLFVSGKPIIIPDIQPLAFQAMLHLRSGKPQIAIAPNATEKDSSWPYTERFIYEGCAKVSDFGTCCALLCAAKKYALPVRMLEDCRAVLWSLVHPGHAWPALTFATQNYEEEIYDTAVEVIQKTGSTCFAQDALLEVPHSILLAFLQNHGCVNVKNEGEIFNACLRWAKNQLVINNKEDTAQNVREVLGEIVKYINFKDLDLNEYSEILENDNCIKNSDISPREAEKYDSYFIFGKNCDNPNVIKGYDKNYRIELDTYDLFTTIKFPTVINSKTKLFKLLGIRYPTQIKNSEDDCYMEDVSIYICADNRLIGNTRFNAFVQYDSWVNIELTREFVIDSWEQISVIIIPHKSGRYPTQYFKFTGVNSWTIKRGCFKEELNAIFLYCPDSLIMPILRE